jgi:hypothetical protein
VEAFCDKPSWCDEVNHKDGVKQNNIYTNLEWTTHQANVAHAVENGLTKKRKRVVATCVKTGIKTEYESGMHAARAMGNVNRNASISLAARGKKASAYGFTEVSVTNTRPRAGLFGASHPSTARPLSPFAWSSGRARHFSTTRRKVTPWT